MVNTWWADDPLQRYWMEVTDRQDLGGDLHAPQRDDSGAENWTYALVAATRPGDVVFHWHTGWFETSAIVGWSEVIGPLQTIEDYSWRAHSTRGRAAGTPTVGRGWRMPCANFTELSQPLDRNRMLELRTPVLQIAKDLRRRHGATYFPFSRYRDGLRATQGYLMKFPVELVELLPELREAMLTSPTAAPPPSNRPRRGPGRLHDPALRRAIELHAVEAAREYYLAAGASEVVVLGKPYDLLVRGLGDERHVEVKGSSLHLDKVLLTVNEVTHARVHEATDLFVVDEIAWQADGAGSYTTSGGRERLWPSWTPHDKRLAALQYEYELDDPA